MFSYWQLWEQKPTYSTAITSTPHRNTDTPMSKTEPLLSQDKYEAIVHWHAIVDDGFTYTDYIETHDLCRENRETIWNALVSLYEDNWVDLDVVDDKTVFIRSDREAKLP